MAESFLPSLQNMPNWNEYKAFALKTQADNNAWSAQQAQKQMDFQAQMANTAHQREVADLKAAGLNPVLSAGGSGASAPSGAAGQTDNSVLQSITSYLMQQNQNLVQLEAQRVSAETAKETAQIHAQAQMAAAATAAAASRYAADKNYQLQIELASKYPNNPWSTLSAILNGDEYNGQGLIKRASNFVKDTLNKNISSASANFINSSSVKRVFNTLNPFSQLNSYIKSIRNGGKITNYNMYSSILNWMKSNPQYYNGKYFTYSKKSYWQMDYLEKAVYNFLHSGQGSGRR